MPEPSIPGITLTRKKHRSSAFFIAVKKFLEIILHQANLLRGRHDHPSSLSQGGIRQYCDKINSMLKKFIDEILKKIIEHNTKVNHDSIPHSDTFEKEIQSLLGIDRADLELIIRILKESHNIFTFEIIKEDADNDIKRVDGYVETDLQTIRKLKNFFQKLLMDEYEKQFNKRLLVHQIVKDIYSRPRFYKNTMLGQIGNKSIMLAEYENYIERNFTEYTDTWKTKKLAAVLKTVDTKMLHEAGPHPANKEQKSDPRQTGQRAVDSPQYQNYSSGKSKQSLAKVLQIYGVEFFFR